MRQAHYRDVGPPTAPPSRISSLAPHAYSQCAGVPHRRLTPNQIADDTRSMPAMYTKRLHATCNHLLQPQADSKGPVLPSLIKRPRAHAYVLTRTHNTQQRPNDT